MQCPANINPVQWSQAVGLARQAAARVYREGGGPREAALSFGVKVAKTQDLSWDRAIEMMAERVSSSVVTLQPVRQPERAANVSCMDGVRTLRLAAG
ncbi:MAG: hypothetical protein R3D57_18515 [Hyphomicrobiaceae bacterium]